MSNFEQEMGENSQLVVNRQIDGGFVVGDQEYKGSILITTEEVISVDVSSHRELTRDFFDSISDKLTPAELVLFGCGSSFHMWPKGLDSYVRSKKFSFEYMMTQSAISTLTILQAENRSVNAILIP